VSDTSVSGPVPRALRYVSMAAVVAGVAMIFLGGWRIGVTWDEPLHVQRFNNYVDTGWYLGDGQLDDGKPAQSMTQQYVYAPATMLLLHGLGVVTGVEDPGAASAAAHAYAVRHLGIGLISLIGLLAVFGTARLLFRRWDWAVVSAGVLAALPMWTGHSMFNLKDVPVATGYSLATLGLAVIARGAQGRDWRLRAAGPVALASGIFLAVGTRPGMWVGIFASLVVLVGCWLLRPGDGSVLQRIRTDLWRYRDIALGVVVAGVGLWVIDPHVFSSPFHALWRAAFSSANFFADPSPWTFVPVRVFLEVPIVMLGFVAFGVFVAARQLIRVRLRPGVFESRLLLVLVQTFALPLVAIVHGASLYSDLRQLLFAAPATALICTYGIRSLVERARAGADPRGPRMVAALACVALVAPLVDQATLFPYNYAYYNPLATVAQIRTDGEYYRGSGRELVPRIPVDGRIVCSPVADDDGRAMRMAHLDGWVDCASALVSPIAAYAGERSLHLRALAPDEFWVVNFSPRHGRIAENCDLITGISRRIGWRRLWMASLSRCTREFPILSTRLVRMSGTSHRAMDLPDLGWSIPQTDGTLIGIRSRGGPSTMTFRLAKLFAGHDVKLIVNTASRYVPDVTFGGTPVETTAPAEGSMRLEIVIPQSLVDRATTEPLTLEFRSRTSAPLELKVLGIQAGLVERP
jgi:hypothetical protein